MKAEEVRESVAYIGGLVRGHSLRPWPDYSAFDCEVPDESLTHRIHDRASVPHLVVGAMTHRGFWTCLWTGYNPSRKHAVFSAVSGRPTPFTPIPEESLALPRVPA